MGFTSRRERRLWSAAGLCVALIYLSLPVARHFAEALRERNLLRLAVASIFIAAAGLIVWRVLTVRPGRRVVIALALVGAAYFALLSLVPMVPEERLHFLEYGLLAILIYEALRERRSNISDVEPRLMLALPPFLLAVTLTAALGWIDEGIQALLPSRVYDLRDVAFNAKAGLLSLLALKLVERAAEHE